MGVPPPRVQPPPRKHAPRRAGAAVLRALLCALALAIGVPAAPAQDRRDPATTERELRRIRAELQEIARERRRLEGQRGDAARRLREADERLGRLARELARTEEALQREQQALAGLQQRRAELERERDARRERLARLLRASYALGSHASLKLLLSQDRVADAQRVLAYYRYAQRDHARHIAELAESLQALEATGAEIAERTRTLEALRAGQAAQLAELQRERGRRAALVGELDQRYQDRQQKEKALGQDARALERLLAQLRAAAAKAEAERRAAARRAEEEARQQGSRAPGKVPPKVATSAPPPRVGGLGWPASGELLARFGGRLPDGRTSNGVLIGAPAGSPVTAVADGTVVFSEWMTGYGLILIIDHGNGYMSLYAHNDALLRDAGERVRRGDQVARVGTSGGHGRPALYFELRHNGRPVDPSAWLQRR